MKSIKVIELSTATASTLAKRLWRAAVTADVCQFSDIHGNTYLVCHGTETGQVCFSGTPTQVEYILERAYQGAGLQRGDRRHAETFNLICCHASQFRGTYSAGADYTSDPVTGRLIPGTTIRAQHVFKGDEVPKGWLTGTTVVGNYLFVETVAPIN